MLRFFEIFSLHRRRIRTFSVDNKRFTYDRIWRHNSIFLYREWSKWKTALASFLQKTIINTLGKKIQHFFAKESNDINKTRTTLGWMANERILTKSSEITFSNSIFKKYVSVDTHSYRRPYDTCKKEVEMRANFCLEQIPRQPSTRLLSMTNKDGFSLLCLKKFSW